MRVLVDERIELRRDRRLVAEVDVDKIDPAGDSVEVGGVAGLAGEFGSLEAGRRLAAGVEADGGRRPADVPNIG